MVPHLGADAADRPRSDRRRRHGWAAGGRSGAMRTKKGIAMIGRRRAACCAAPRLERPMPPSPTWSRRSQSGRAGCTFVAAVRRSRPVLVSVGDSSPPALSGRRGEAASIRSFDASVAGRSGRARPPLRRRCRASSQSQSRCAPPHRRHAHPIDQPARNHAALSVTRCGLLRRPGHADHARWRGFWTTMPPNRCAARSTRFSRRLRVPPAAPYNATVVL